MEGDWEQLTDDELVRGFMETYGMSEPDARRQVELARGRLTLGPLEQTGDQAEAAPLAAWLNPRP
jgi:hypothetical protein